ncbi:TetR family transcriptional regulator [Streptomyces olivaceoviridis]|uniref:hypothetical protein n=1 Tax=Streptomyces olivaceoviridis TaxID=1921 RepID=UPI001676E1CB|nr:hypothetical protein [Streptomyces olivaceoviridis]GGY80733.1 TetR family transcriptional regulator [Streptomyces olivaceoviridis]
MKPRRAGISQAYVCWLFPNKELLFTAVVEHCFVRARTCPERAAAEARGCSPEAVLGAMGDAYARLAEYGHGASGGGEEQVREFFARGMLCHLIRRTAVCPCVTRSGALRPGCAGSGHAAVIFP